MMTSLEVLKMTISVKKEVDKMRPSHVLVSGLIDKVSRFFYKPTKADEIEILIRQSNPTSDKNWSNEWASYFASGGTIKGAM